MTASKINLCNDYNSVAHERVLQALQVHLGERFEGYGTDQETAEAEALLLELIQCPEADVHFLAGGTQTNLIAISSFLRPHEAVISPSTAHIAVHEAGAIEATGHKVLVAESNDGKIRSDDVLQILKSHTDEHMVKPRLVYLSQTTELGGVYGLAELEDIRAVCDEHDLLLYIDGARLAYALGSEACDFDLPTIAKLADAFYFGGTKIGLLFGEALIITNPDLQHDARFLIKQRGGLVAKGFVLGIQFKVLLKDNLYLELATHANIMAAQLSAGLADRGYTFQIKTETNQVFPIVQKSALDALHSCIAFEEWSHLSPSQTSIRFVTTGETTEDDIHAVLELLDKYSAR